MPGRKVREFLDREGVPYEVVPHPLTYTAHDTARAVGGVFAKVVLVKLDGQLAMFVLPSTSRLRLDELRDECGVRDVELATEPEFRSRFPDCEVGAVPPFGFLFGLPMWIDLALTRADRIAFDSGNHREALRMATSDFLRVVPHRILGGVPA